MSVDLERPRVRASTWRLALAWTITAGLLAATLAPASWIAFLRGGGPGEEHVSAVLFGLVPFDKFVHFSLFAALSTAWVGALPPRWSTFGKVLAIVVVLAVGTELLQGLPIIARDGGVADGLADLIGGGSALAVLGLARFRRDRNRRSSTSS